MIRLQIAELASKVLNPFWVCMVILLFVAFWSTGSVSGMLKWFSLSLGIIIVPVYGVLMYLVRTRGIGKRIVDIREQRTAIYITASISALVGCAVLFLLGAPRLYMASLIAGATNVFVFMLVNFRWKISVHAAFTAASIAVLIILCGAAGAFSVVLLPLVAWARIVLKHHSVAQVAAGMVLSPVIVLVVFSLFGVLTG